MNDVKVMRVEIIDGRVLEGIYIGRQKRLYVYDSDTGYVLYVFEGITPDTANDVITLCGWDVTEELTRKYGITHEALDDLDTEEELRDLLISYDVVSRNQVHCDWEPWYTLAMICSDLCNL